MYAVDMDILPFANTTDAIKGLMYSIASRCAGEFEFNSSFEPKLVSPFVFFNPYIGPEHTAMCK